MLYMEKIVFFSGENTGYRNSRDWHNVEFSGAMATLPKKKTNSFVKSVRPFVRME